MKIRWRNEWSKITIKFILILFLELFKNFFNFAIYFAVIFLFILHSDNLSEVVTFLNNEEIKNLINGISALTVQGKMNVIWTIFFVQFCAFSIFSGIQASKWELNNGDDYLFQNVYWNNQDKKFILFYEQMVWNIKRLFTSLIPFLVAILFVTKPLFLQGLVTFVIIIVTYIVQTQLIAIIHNYLTIRKTRNERYFNYIIIQSLLLKAAILAAGYFLGKVVSPWINTFPILGRVINQKAYEQWLFEGRQILQQGLNYIFDIFLWKYWPHNFMSRIAVASSEFISWIYWSAWIATSLFIVFLLARMADRQMSTRAIEKPIWLEKMFLALAKGLVRMNKQIIIARVKVFCRDSYTLQRASGLFGGMLIWGLIGACSSLIRYAESDKVYFLVTTMVSYIVIFQLSALLFDSFLGHFSLDSDGKKISLYVSSGQTIWSVFIQKLQLFLIISMPQFVLCEIVFIILGGRAGYAMMIFVHIVNYLCFAVIHQIAGFMSPHYNFINKEQLDEFTDRTTVNTIVRMCMLSFVIPCLLLPLAFYIADYMDKTSFLIIQFVVSPIAILAVWIGSLLYVRRKHNSRPYIDDFNL
ncbi:hypothetical protein [Paenibacillus sp. KS-LC4]|uniref:hypothetical protein n=1 Tax=Paenibacillus sp. KS-LC4 TaxID=2979727 RepID=UPI0030CE33A3